MITRARFFGFAVLMSALACSVRDEVAATTRAPARTTTGGAVSTLEAIANGTAAVPVPSYKAISKWSDYQPLKGSRYGVIILRESAGSRLTDARIQLVGPDGIVSDVGTVPANETSLELIRADTTAIVFYRFGDYGRNAPIKIFLDPATKQGIKQIEFSSNSGLVNISSQDIASALQIPSLLATSLKGRDPEPGPEESWDTYLPQALKDHRMPASTYAEFARERPERVEGGYDSTSSIGEGPGPVHIDGSRIWFGKTFYDGEGMSGVGGVGYFDTLTSAYTFLKIPQLVSWSVSTLLVDDQTLWVGLVGHPEGMDYGGGLLRHDLKTGETREYEVDAVIHRIKRWNGRTYLGTATGAVVIEGDHVVARYLVEPDLTGKLILVRTDR